MASVCLLGVMLIPRLEQVHWCCVSRTQLIITWSLACWWAGWVHKLQDCGFLVFSVCPQQVQLVQTTVDSMEGLVLQRILEDFGILGLVPANW